MCHCDISVMVLGIADKTEDPTWAVGTRDKYGSRLGYLSG